MASMITPSTDDDICTDDDIYIRTDENGRRHWIEPVDDPEPRKAGPDGFMSPVWAQWEGRMLERRRRGIPPTEPMREPELTGLEAELEHYAALLADAQRIVEFKGRRKLAKRAELERATTPRHVMHSGGTIEQLPVDAAEVARLEAELTALGLELVDARELEVSIRRLINAASAPTRRSGNVASFADRHFSYNTRASINNGTLKAG